MKSDKKTMYNSCRSWIFDLKSRNCKNNPEKFSTKKLCEYILCGYSTSIIWVFDNIENKYSLYRGEVCIKLFCSSLREHAANLLSFEKKRKCYC